MFIDTLFSACFPYNAIHIPWKISDGEVGDSSADWPIMRLLQRDHWSIYPTEQHRYADDETEPRAGTDQCVLSTANQDIGVDVIPCVLRIWPKPAFSLANCQLHHSKGTSLSLSRSQNSQLDI